MQTMSSHGCYFGQLQIKAGKNNSQQSRMWLSSLILSKDTVITTENLTDNMETYQVKKERGFSVISGPFMTILGRTMKYIEIKKDSWTTIAENIEKTSKPDNDKPLQIKLANDENSVNDSEQFLNIDVENIFFLKNLKFSKFFDFS